MPNILFAEDELILGRLVSEALEREPDFLVSWVKNGEAALEAYKAHIPDICILDVMLPSIDGYELAQKLRSLNNTLPILFLTARNQTTDVIKGFESGGNDYLKKPFSIEELVIRLRELLKRMTHLPASLPTNSSHFQFGSFTFNPATQTLRSPKGTYQLSGKESDLMQELVLHKNTLMKRKETLLKLWGDDNFFNARNMDVYIARLRKYLVHDPALSIVNIRGYGFKLIEQS